MKLKKIDKHEMGKHEHESKATHVNSKDLTDNAEKLAKKQPKGRFYGHRWFPYNESK